VSGTTSIEWATDTWNPTKGCDRVSPGCDHCYAMTMAKRLKGMGSPGYQQDGDPRTSGPGFLAHESPTDLDWPLRKTKPRLIFVNSMSDLFHDNISDEFIAQVFAVMAVAPRHTFQVLTKRHARMRSLLSSDRFAEMYDEAVGHLWHRDGLITAEQCNAAPELPLPNVWLGVSVENQQWADIRIPALLDTPAAVRFLSCEPLLGPIDLVVPNGLRMDGGPRRDSALIEACPNCGGWGGDECPNGAHFVKRVDGIDWVIAGGESGPGARPMEADWARSLRDQCNVAGVPFLFKQWGDWYDGERLGKKEAGRILDGRTWDEYPAARA
jgi:protein gp37